MAKIWKSANILPSARIGENVNIGQYAEIGGEIGDNCKIQAFAFIPNGVKIGKGVFVGPHAVFTNDREPRAEGEWEITPTIVKEGASIGANATILCGITIGENAIIGCGSVVTKDVPPGEIWAGNPAKYIRKKV